MMENRVWHWPPPRPGGRGMRMVLLLLTPGRKQLLTHPLEAAQLLPTMVLLLLLLSCPNQLCLNPTSSAGGVAGDEGKSHLLSYSPASWTTSLSSFDSCLLP